MSQFRDLLLLIDEFLDKAEAVQQAAVVLHEEVKSNISPETMTALDTAISDADATRDMIGAERLRTR